MMTTSSKHLSKILIVILGVMTAFGPLTIDMYGPSLPIFFQAEDGIRDIRQ